MPCVWGGLGVVPWLLYVAEEAPASAPIKESSSTPLQREEQKWMKKLREIEAIEQKEKDTGKMDPAQKDKLARKPEIGHAFARTRLRLRPLASPHPPMSRF